MPLNADDILTLRDASRILGIDPSLIRRYCESGRLTAKLIGGRWLMDRKDLERFAREPRRRGNPNFGNSPKKRASKK